MEKKIEKLKTEMSEIYGERLAFDHWEELEYSVIDEIGLKLNEIIDYLNSQEQELDKARGELLANIMGFVHNSKNSREDIKGYIGELYVDNKYDVVHGLRMPVRESELDKLKDNK